MQDLKNINERGDIIISPDDNLNEQIQELINTKQDGWLKTIPLLFNYIESIKLMKGIINQLEIFNQNWENKEFYNMICELNEMLWIKLYQKGQKKSSISPYNEPQDFEKVKVDQEEINKQTMLKFQSHQQQN
jgi:hypothetical protein